MSGRGRGMGLGGEGRGKRWEVRGREGGGVLKL